MAKKKSLKLSAFGSRLTALVSVTLVLVLLGVIALAGVMAHNGADMIKRNMGFTIRVDHSATPDQLKALKESLPKARYAASVTYFSPAQILEQEKASLGDDIIDMLDINPYNPEFEVKVTPQYASPDSIAALSQRLSANPAIEEVITSTATVTNVNFFLSRVTLLMAAIAVVLLLISFVLINNTVYLAVYARRFTIHTMKLVGATAGFIRRPFIRTGVITGLIAGLLAAALVCGARFWLGEYDPLMTGTVDWQATGLIAGALVLTGMLICLMASWLATSRYLRADYDDMFMK